MTYPSLSAFVNHTAAVHVVSVDAPVPNDPRPNANIGFPSNDDAELTSRHRSRGANGTARSCRAPPLESFRLQPSSHQPRHTPMGPRGPRIPPRRKRAGFAPLKTSPRWRLRTFELHARHAQPLQARKSAHPRARVHEIYGFHRAGQSKQRNVGCLAKHAIELRRRSCHCGVGGGTRRGVT